MIQDVDLIKGLSVLQRKKLREEDAADGGHNRKQRLLNALTSVATAGVYVVPLILTAYYQKMF